MYVPHLGLSPETTNTDEITAIENGDVIAGEELILSPLFFDTGIKISYNIDLKHENKIQFSIGVKNIFDQIQNDYDKGVYRDASYIYGPSKPRTLFVSIKFTNL
jgi:outer membrane receptor for ferrienterochelin and colicins